MSAPSPAPAEPSAPAPTVPSARLIVLRLLAVASLVAVGFVAVWQGFGAAGYGTDVHTKRVSWVCFQLIGFALVLVCMKGWFPVRVLVALVFFASAGAAWWTVRSSDFKSAMSLREAIESRDRYREQLATAKVEDLEQNEGLRGIAFLIDQYPTLTPELAVDYERWKDRMWHELTDRYNRTAPDDTKAIHELRAATKRLARIHPEAGKLLADTDRAWVSRAVGAKAAELVKLHGDWDGFERTAPGRHALAEAFPETRAELSAAEEEWAEVTAVGMVWFQNRGASPNERPRVDWRAQEKAVLALKSIDTGPDRFARTRRELFEFAHDVVRADVSAHLEAGRYEQAFGLARKHAVEWNATAIALGEGEVKKLDALRAQCEALAKLYDVSAKPTDPAEIAPPPRTKPE